MAWIRLLVVLLAMVVIGLALTTLLTRDRRYLGWAKWLARNAVFVFLAMMAYYALVRLFRLF